MTSSRKLLITAGDNIKVWDLDTYDLVKQMNPHGEAMSCVVWSPDQQNFASASIGSDKIIITYPDLNWRNKEILEKKHQTKVNYSSDGKLLVTGGTDGTVHIFNLASSQLMKSFDDIATSTKHITFALHIRKLSQHAITSVLFMNKDSTVVATNSDGDIYVISMISLDTKINAHRYACPIQHVDNSKFECRMFAAAGIDGSVTLWDMATMSGTSSTGQRLTDGHASTCYNLSFSSYNEMLLTSVGLDKRVILHDVRMNSSAHVINTEEPLTCVTMLADGTSINVGTSLGSVMSYDLREANRPVVNLKAHTTSIKSLSCNDPISLSVNNLFSPCRKSIDYRSSLRYSYDSLADTSAISALRNVPEITRPNLTLQSIQQDPHQNFSELKGISEKMDKMMDSFDKFQSDSYEKMHSMQFKMSYQLTKMEDTIKKNNELFNEVLNKLTEENEQLKAENDNLKCIY